MTIQNSNPPLYPPDLLSLAQRLVTAATQAQKTIVTAESITGGLVAGAITEIPGASAVLQAGFVTYSNAAKQRMLDVPADLITQHGAVSENVAAAMAMGALRQSNADLAVSLTGLASPGGENGDYKPTGLVFIGLAERMTNDENPRLIRPHLIPPRLIRVEKNIFPGDRTAIRLACVKHALLILMTALDHAPSN